MESTAIIIGIIVGVVVLLPIVFFAMVTRFYVKAPADRAYVRTGGTKPKVVVNGGSWVIPAFHEITWVDLRTMDIDVERTEANALLTIDPQYADIRAIFYIKVNPIADDIERAARTIGGKEVNTESVKRLVESKLEGGLRDVAATFSLMSLHQEREKFVERVQNLVRGDLAENGLVLEAVSITTLKSARQGSFGVDDVFGAQVARANAEVIQHALKQRNEIDQTTQTEIAKRNATAEQERNDIERNKQLEIARYNVMAAQHQNDVERSSELEIATRNATVEQEKLSLERNIEQARATQQREIMIRQSEEQQAAELARVEKERAVAEAEQVKEQSISLAEQRKQQAIQLAQQEREREVQRSIVLRDQAVQVADRERQVALAQEQAKLEAAEKERLVIAAQREAAEQEVVTVQERAAAEREAQIQIINAERDAKREMINRRNTADIEAYKQVKDAEAEAEALNKKATAEATAAIKMAEARRTEAQAAADSEKLHAEASRATAAAQGLAEAEVIRAKAEAANQEAEAIKAKGLAEAEAIKAKGLAEAEGQLALSEALAAHEGVTQRLELERIRLQAQIEIGVAQAHAMGEAMASMDFKLYGTPDTAQQLLRMVGISDGIGSLLNTMPAPLKEVSGRLLDRILPANGDGNGHATPALPTINLDAAQPLIAESAAIVGQLLTAEELATLTVREALEQALLIVDDSAQRTTLLKAQGALLLVPSIAEQPVSAVISTATA